MYEEEGKPIEGFFGSSKMSYIGDQFGKLYIYKYNKKKTRLVADFSFYLNQNEKK